MPTTRIGRVKIGESPKLVAAITAPQRPAQLSQARAAGADIAELRLDYISHWPDEKIVEAVRNAARSGDLPLIATLRTPREGGARKDGVVADEKRREALFRMLIPHVHAVDMELSSPILDGVVAAAHKQGIPAIVSYHHFQSTPSLTRLRALAQLCKAKGGDIAKVTTHTRTPVEMIRLLSLLHEKPSQPLAAFAIGKHALLSRLMAFFFQSSLIYGAVPASGTPAAPGIPAIADLKDTLKRFKLA